MNTVRVLLFARARELAGSDWVAAPLGPGATVADLRRCLEEQVPPLADLLPRCAIGVNGQYADDKMTVPANADVAVIPPVSGG